MWNAPDYVAEQALLEASRIQRQVLSAPNEPDTANNEEEQGNE